MTLNREFAFYFTHAAYKNHLISKVFDGLPTNSGYEPIKFDSTQFERHFLHAFDVTGKCACVLKIETRGQNGIKSTDRQTSRTQGKYDTVFQVRFISHVDSKMGKRKHSTDSGDESDDSCKRLKKAVRFGEVTIYHFPRKQGFVSVPSSGGSTLGMARKHVWIEKICVDFQLDAAASRDERKPFAPVAQKARKTILKTAGVRRILKKEEQDCAQLRHSRVICGCSCGDICYPETCECILSGIGCQVDYGRFPCSCQPNGCQNSYGRKQYNPGVVEKHYFETFARINGQRGATTVLQYVGVV